MLPATLREHESWASTRYPHSKTGPVPSSGTENAPSPPPPHRGPSATTEIAKQTGPYSHKETEGRTPLARHERWTRPPREEEKAPPTKTRRTWVPTTRPTTTEVWISFNGQPYQMVTIPRKDTTGQSLLECFKTKLGIPPNILKIYRGSQLICGQKTYTIPSGTFLSATLGLPGGIGFANCHTVPPPPTPIGTPRTPSRGHLLRTAQKHVGTARKHGAWTGSRPSRNA